MASISQNGWSGISSSRDSKLVNFPAVTGRVRKGDVEDIFNWLVKEYEANVEEIRRDWSWAWSYRNIRGAFRLSNHASATALDFNAPRHPLGVDPTKTMTARQIRQCKEIASKSGGVLRWGGIYAGRKDTMHWEINRDSAAVARFADKIRGNVTPVGNTKPKPKPKADPIWTGLTKAQTANVQRYLRSIDKYDGAIDGKYQSKTKAGVREFQLDANRYGGAKFIGDGLWEGKTQAWYHWVKILQNAVAEWKASERLGKMLADHHYGALTNRHVAEVQEDNMKAYIKLGGGVVDGKAGPITCKLLGIAPFKW